MPNKDKNIPKRRFKEFENADAWELRKLGEYSTLITKGTTPRDKSGIGVVNFVKVENLVNGDIIPLQKIQLEEHEGYLKRSQLIENDILFSIAGTLGRTAIVKKSILPANTNQALSIIRGYEFDRNFLVTILRGVVVREFIKRNPTIGAQPNLSLEQVSNLCLLTPCSEEQSAIGTFFSTLDQHITLHQRKLDKLKSVKQAYLSEMFPAEGERVPKRRFPGFTDAWEQRKLGEISEKVTLKNKDNTFDETLTNSAEFGIISQNDFFDKEISNRSNLNGYYVVENNNFVYNPRISNFAPVGPIKRNKLGRTGVMSPLYYVFKTRNIDNDFLEKYFDTTYWHIFMKLNGDSGARADRFAIKDSVFKEMPIPFPKIEEQIKIGNFFKQLDDTIALHQRKLEKLKNLKKALLNELFV